MPAIPDLPGGLVGHAFQVHLVVPAQEGDAVMLTGKAHALVHEVVAAILLT